MGEYWNSTFGLQKEHLKSELRKAREQAEAQYAEHLAELQARCPHQKEWVGEDYPLGGVPYMKCWACDKILK